MDASASKSAEIHAITSASLPSTLAQARELLLEYGRFVIAQPGAARFCFGSLEKEAERLPESYTEQGGGSLIALLDTHPAGFIAWRELPASVSPDAWEMKRLWVRPQARGLSLGKALTEAVLDRARRAGRQSVYLDTAPASMAAAHRMYLALGFVPCPMYNDNPVEGLAYLVKHL
jgi:putative acetyltransferase